MGVVGFPGCGGARLRRRGRRLGVLGNLRGLGDILGQDDAGAWIAWQAYRERHAERGFFPRFSLRTLIVGTFSWGVLLAVFMPVTAQ